jgi:uncharacterized membrane protein
VFGVLFTATLPPLGGYDEGVHFLRAWHVSNGHAFAEEGVRTGDTEPTLGASVPSGLRDQLVTLLRVGVLDHDNARRTWSHLGDPAPAGHPTFVDFAAAAVYPPVPYVPSAIGIRVGRLFGGSAFVLVLLARLASLAAFIAIIALAIRRLPTRAWVLAILALTPVALFQAAAVSADAITTALALLVVADAIALMARPPDAVPRGLLIETIVAVLALAGSKQPYFLAAALLLLPAWRHRRAIGVAVIGALAVGSGVALAWAHWANDHYLPPDFLPASLGGHANYANHDVHPSKQIAYLRGHPFAFVRAVGRMVTDYGASIAHDLVAQTSFWRVPNVVAVLIALGLVAILVVDAGPLPGGRLLRTVALSLAAAIVVVTLLLAYVGWNTLRAPRLDGFQGRYLLLVLGIVCLVASPDRERAGVKIGSLRAGNFEIAPLLVAWSAVMLLAVEVGLGWHSYR